jgi:S1-C subfamily serine protease
MSHRLITAAAALAAATILGVAVGYGAYAIADDEPEATRAPATATPTAAVASTTAVQTVYERAAAGVVEVATSATAEDAPFGGGRQRGVGSGFVYDDDGHVVTNHHVVEGAETVNVTFSDGSRSRATVVGSDPTTDLAVLEVEGGTGDRRPLGLAPEGSIEVGELAVAIGSPYGFDGTPASSARSIATSPPRTASRSAARSRRTPRSTRATPAARCSMPRRV